MIAFVRKYNRFNSTIYEVMHENGNKRPVCRTYFGDDVPKTVKVYMNKAKVKKQMDRYHGEEEIYTCD